MTATTEAEVYRLRSLYDTIRATEAAARDVVERVSAEIDTIAQAAGDAWEELFMMAELPEKIET